MPGVEAIQSGTEGAIMGGILKDAKIVTLSLRQNNAYETLGMVGVCFAIFAAVAAAAADDEEAPVAATVTAGAEGWH
jgi:hypothetical protein